MTKVEETRKVTRKGLRDEIKELEICMRNMGNRTPEEIRYVKDIIKAYKKELGKDLERASLTTG